MLDAREGILGLEVLSVQRAELLQLYDLRKILHIEVSKPSARQRLCVQSTVYLQQYCHKAAESKGGAQPPFLVCHLSPAKR